MVIDLKINIKKQIFTSSETETCALLCMQLHVDFLLKMGLIELNMNHIFYLDECEFSRVNTELDTFFKKNLKSLG